VSLALAMRQLLWRDEADRALLAEEISRRVAAEALRETVVVEDVNADC
jgi:hypothetical protein